MAQLTQTKDGGTTMKAYTDIEQSKKLAEILPLESADMWYCPYPNDVDWYDEPRIGKADLLLNQLSCWSLASLLGIIPEPILTCIDKNNWNISTFENNHFKDEVISSNPVDACYEMILKLNKQNLLCL